MSLCIYVRIVWIIFKFPILTLASIMWYKNAEKKVEYCRHHYAEKEWPFHIGWESSICFSYINLRQTLKLLIIKSTHLKINTWYAVWGKCSQNMLKHNLLQWGTTVECWVLTAAKLFIRDGGDAFWAKLTGRLQEKEWAGKNNRPRHLQSSSFCSPAQGRELSSIMGVYSIFVKQRIGAPLWWVP